MNADRDRSEQPVDLLAALQRSIDRAKDFQRTTDHVERAFAPQKTTEPRQSATEVHGDDERQFRDVCDTCGAIFGEFHKDCDGRWVEETRTVSAWTRNA